MVKHDKNKIGSVEDKTFLTSDSIMGHELILLDVNKYNLALSNIRTKTIYPRLTVLSMLFLLLWPVANSSDWHFMLPGALFFNVLYNSISVDHPRLLAVVF